MNREPKKTASGILSKNFIKDLLIVNALQNTDSEYPKTSREIIIEVKTTLHKLFPNDFPESDIKSLIDTEKNVPPTVSRIVHDMNLLTNSIQSH